MDRSTRKHYGRQRRIRPSVDRKINRSTQQLALFAYCRAMARTRWMTLCSRGHILGAIVGDFYRVPTLHRKQRSVRPYHRGEILLAAKCPAGLGLNNAALVFGQVEHEC